MWYGREFRTFALGLIIVMCVAGSGHAEWIKEYDSQEDPNLTAGTHSGIGPWGESNGIGIDSWYLIVSSPDAKIERLSLFVHDVTGQPYNYN